jgi:hypothetical protein
MAPPQNLGAATGEVKDAAGSLASARGYDRSAGEDRVPIDV